MSAPRGSRALSSLAGWRGCSVLFFRALRGLVSEPPLARGFWRSTAEVGYGSLAVVIAISAATGKVRHYPQS